MRTDVSSPASARSRSARRASPASLSLSGDSASPASSPVPSPAAEAKDNSTPASPSARPKDVVDSYLRQLYGGNTDTRMLAAQGLGAMPSFLTRAQQPSALKLAVELGVVGALAQVLTEDDVLPVQEACLLAVASLLLATAPYEEHAAPLKPPHLKQLGAILLRPEVLRQMGYIVTTTSASRVVLAAARVVTILAPYITQSNDFYLLDSRIIPALLAAIATPNPSHRSFGPPSPGSSAAATPRDAAACVLALLVLAQATPDLYLAVRTADFFQAISVLYQRCIDPDQPSVILLPADVAALLLRAVTMEPDPRWAASSLPKNFARTAEEQLEECDALECLVSYVAVEAANLRQLGQDVAAVVAENARAVMEKNGVELDHIQTQLQERQHQLTEAKEAAREARRAVEEAEADAVAAHDTAEAADSVVRAARNGGSPAQRQARREAEAAAGRAEEAVEERRRALAAAEEAVVDFRGDVTALRRSAAPVRWQGDRMGRIAGAAQHWQEQYGAKSRSKVRITRPSLGMLSQVLAYLSALVKAPAAPERGTPSRGLARSPALPRSAPSPEHLEALQAKLLEAGLVQAMGQLYKILAAVKSLADDLAALAGDLALHPDMAGALGGAAEVLSREAGALEVVKQRAELRRKQVTSEVLRLRKALKLGFPQGSPRWHSELGPSNSLSRELRPEDVERRLRTVETEAEELSAVLQDAEALMEMLQGRLQAVHAAATDLADCHAAFVKAFPTQASPATPAVAPTAGTPGAPGGPSPGRTISLASQHIMAKDPSHPGGHLLGLLARALAPLTHGSSNLAALIRQLQGRLPEGAAGATWPPARPASASDGGGSSRLRATSVGSSRAGGISRPGSARSAQSAGGAGVGGVSGTTHGVGRSSTGRRPLSTRSSLGGGLRPERSTASGLISPRASAAYGAPGFSSSGYGDGVGGVSGFPGSGPYPTDGLGRPMRYPQDSMYGIIQSTFSPLRGYSAPSNGPQLAQAIRVKGLRASAASSTGAGLRNSGVSMPLNASVTASAALTAEPGALDVFGSVSMPLADESRRVVLQAVSSVLFDPIDPDVLGPGVVRASAGSITLANGVASRQATAYGSRRTTGYDSVSGGGVVPEGSAGALVSPRSAGGSVGGAGLTGGAGGGAGGGDMSVLDALLMQTELLCSVFDSLSAIQQFARTTSRICCRLPSAVSYSSLVPGALGPFMAQLHAMWSDAIAHQPDMRVRVTDRVTQIAELALVPAADFDSVYRETGLVDVLVAMLAGHLRPPGKVDPAKDAGPASEGGSQPAGDAAVAPAGAPLRPRYVGRLTATAPPTLRLGPVQQAEQAAAAHALRAISHAQSEVLTAIAQDDKLLARMSSLCLDHSISWTARTAAAELLADLVLGGGQAAEAAVANGAYAGLVESINREMFPFLNQDPRASKESVVSALACMVAHPELLEGVVAAAQAPTGPSAGLPLDSTDQAMAAILRSLWSVCQLAYSTYTADRSGHGRNVDPELISGLVSTATTAARELSVLADTVPEARRALGSDLGIKRKLDTHFLQAMKDPALHEALVELRKMLS